MGLSLKLELKANNYVLVTNSATLEQIEVTLDFIYKATKNPLSMLSQYKYYELILEAEKHWNNIKKYKVGKETEIIKEIELEELEYIANIRSDVRRQEREKTAAKQQHWNEIAAYNKAQRELREKRIAEHQRQLQEHIIAKNQKSDEITTKDRSSVQPVDNDFNILLKSQKSYNRTLIALEYADYCLEHDYRYNFDIGIEQNIIRPIAGKDLLREQEIVALKEENKALREKIAELEAKYIDSPSVFAKANCIVGEIVS